jgi:hypothetical protein
VVWEEVQEAVWDEAQKEVLEVQEVQEEVQEKD